VQQHIRLGSPLAQDDGKTEDGATVDKGWGFKDVEGHHLRVLKYPSSINQISRMCEVRRKILRSGSPDDLVVVGMKYQFRENEFPPYFRPAVPPRRRYG
jgi:hypothetical protein